MDKRFDNIVSKLKSIHFSVEEKSEVRDRVLSVIEKLEAVSVLGEGQRRPIKSPYVSKIIAYIEYRKFIPAFVIAGILFVSGGVSMAAERALPGDSLYGLKKVNEEVLGFTAITPQAKAELAVEVSERRLQEAATLSARGQLSDATNVALQQDFQKQADQVKNQVASLVSENNISAAQEIAVNYESSLKAHEVILQKVSGDNTDSTSSPSDHISSLLAVVRNELATTTLSRVILQNKEIVEDGNNASKASLRLADISFKFQDLLNEKVEAESLGSSTDAVTSANITDASSSIAKAKDYITQQQFDNALIVLQQAARDISDAQSVITADQHTTSDVKKVIDINPSHNATTTSATSSQQSNASASTTAIQTTSSTSSATSSVTLPL